MILRDLLLDVVVLIVNDLFLSVFGGPPHHHCVILFILHCYLILAQWLLGGIVCTFHVNLL